MRTDPWQWGGLGGTLVAVAAFIRKGVKVSTVQLRVVDPKAEQEIAQLRSDLGKAMEQLNGARVELAGLRAELASLQMMRSEFQEEREEWTAERAQLRAHVANLERDLVARRRENAPHGQGDGTQDD